MSATEHEQPGLKQLAELLVRIEAQARAATNLQELAYSIANDSYSLLGFRQALVVQAQPKGHTHVLALSGLAQPTEDSPYLIWLKHYLPSIFTTQTDDAVWLHQKDYTVLLDEAGQSGWQEWWTAGVYVQPLKARNGQNLGWVCFLLEQPPQTWQTHALARLAQSWGYSWEMLAVRQQKRFAVRVLQGLKHKKTWIVLLLLAALFIPVRLTALAPAEIISLDARVITAPIDGVVQEIAVRPNQTVVQGEQLLKLEDTTLKNRLAVARQSVAVAEAEYSAATQKAFHDPTSQSELSLLHARAQEKRAEFEAVQAQLQRVHVNAPASGVAVYADPDDWLGRPVVTGERILLLANPQKLGVLMHLSVADAIGIEPGAEVKLFLKTSPLKPLQAKVVESSYQAMLSPEGIASYTIRAALPTAEAQAHVARIGLQGTAKLYGETVPLGYYLFRRPLASLRAWTGW